VKSRMVWLLTTGTTVEFSMTEEQANADFNAYQEWCKQSPRSEDRSTIEIWTSKERVSIRLSEVVMVRIVPG